MIFIENLAEKLEEEVRTIYFTVLKKSHLDKVSGSTFTSSFNSYRKISKLIENERNNGIKNKLEILDVTNNVILKILFEKAFVYNNSLMALLIGYRFLNIHQITLNNFSSGNITAYSTLEDIRSLTASWLRP